MSEQSLAITHDGKCYASFREFTNYHGLNYSKAQYYRKRGKTPDEIILLCSFSRPQGGGDAPRETSKRLPCEYGGTCYSSIYEASSALGISPGKVYEYKKRKNLSASEAIAQIMENEMCQSIPKEETDKLLLLPCKYKGVEYSSLYEAATALEIHPSQLYELRRRYNLSPTSAVEMAVKKRIENGKRPATAAKKCIVDGVEYPSREAAILAYHIPRITVYSRMEREGISFEEALSRGRKSVTYRPPIGSLYPSLKLKKAKEPLNQPVLELLETSLVRYGQTIKVLKDSKTHLPVLLVNGNVYMFFNHEAMGLEFVSPLSLIISSEELTALNSSYVAAKFFHAKSAQVFMTHFQIAKEVGQDIKQLLHTYFSFSSLREQVIRHYGDIGQ